MKKNLVMFALGSCLLAVAAMVATMPAYANTSDDERTYSSWDLVSMAQRVLQHEGYLEAGSYTKGKPDDATAHALAAFQSAHTLLPTGVLNDETITQLLSHSGQLDSEPRTASIFQYKSRFVLEGVNFAPDTANLTPKSRVALDRVARSLKAAPETQVEIAGYTDSMNTAAYNMRLSRLRAEAVSSYLVDAGVSEGQIVTRAYGESRPIADNRSASGRAQNRRVEIGRID